jgi:ABC-2 type transport system permease protein
MFKRISAIIHKEVIHILRDPRSLIIIFVMPIFMIILFGYAITFDVKNVQIGILDQDRSVLSRELISNFSHSDYFSIIAWPATRDDIVTLINHRRVKAVMVIPPDFAENITRTKNGNVQVIVDGSNANTAIIVRNYTSMLINEFAFSLNAQKALPVDISPRIYYNPELESTDYIVPGLVAVLMMMICAMLTSITIVREKETGSMEQILVSPIRSGEIILGKVIPYIFLGFLVACVVVGFGLVVFAVPFRGNAIFLILFSFIYIYASLSLGVFISTQASTQQVALMLSLVGTLLPSVLLSGFVFPVFAMPSFLQVLSHLVPARYYLTIIRGMMLKGVGPSLLWQPALLLFIFGTLLIMISMKRFQSKLEA